MASKWGGCVGVWLFFEQLRIIGFTTFVCIFQFSQVTAKLVLDTSALERPVL